MQTSAVREEQITSAVRQVERGTAVAEVCRTLGVSAQTCSRWKRQFAGRGGAEWRRLRQVAEEPRTRTPLVAALTRDKPMLQEVLRKKLSSLSSAGSWSSVCAWASGSARAGPAR